MGNDQFWDCDHCQERYPYMTEGARMWRPIEVEIEPEGEVEWRCGACAVAVQPWRPRRAHTR